MKKIIILSAVTLLLATALVSAQSRELRDLEPFENVDLDGNIRLYLENGANTKVVLEAKKDYYIAEYDVEVRNGTLYVKYDEQDYGFGSTPKVYVYLTHPGIHKLDMDGLVHVNSIDTYKSDRLDIKGDGLIRGDLDITVNELSIGLDGLCKLTVFGVAEVAHLSVDGMGKIDARGLRVDKYHQSAEGIASIKVGH